MTKRTNEMPLGSVQVGILTPLPQVLIIHHPVILSGLENTVKHKHQLPYVSQSRVWNCVLSNIDYPTPL